MKVIVSHIKIDYKQMANKDELDIVESYIKESEIYTCTIVGRNVKLYMEIRIGNITIKFLYFMLQSSSTCIFLQQYLLASLMFSYIIRILQTMLI